MRRKHQQGWHTKSAVASEKQVENEGCGCTTWIAERRGGQTHSHTCRRATTQTKLQHTSERGTTPRRRRRRRRRPPPPLRQRVRCEHLGGKNHVAILLALLCVIAHFFTGCTAIVDVVVVDDDNDDDYDDDDEEEDDDDDGGGGGGEGGGDVMVAAG
ncbi:hypothetical protein RB195_021193 [Necator americanus]|uniref:Uncharacterized protein n=1 Tax=Necator americanus TaxID=51031 RepID=A0ABR1E9V2_NECAM